MPQTNQPVYAFIDSQNLNLGINKDLFGKNGSKIYSGWKLDFKKFHLYLVNKYKVKKAFLFIGKIPANQPLYDSLQSYGYELIFKPTLFYVNGNGVSQTKGNVDAELVLHAMIEYNNYSKAIIVSGDGDYYCLVEYLEKNNKLLQLMIPNEYQYSSLLRSYQKYMVFVSRLKSSLSRI